jgi:hypothetical protein
VTDHPGWPALPLEAWRDTRDTLHMALQIVGKVRLALAPMEPQWSQVPLYLTARGLTSSPIGHPRGGPFDLDVDLLDHVVRVRTVRGEVREVALRARPIREFHAELAAALDELGHHVELSPGPSEVSDPIPFAQDDVHRSYDPAWATRFHRALASVDIVLNEHRAGFRGRTTPVHFFWGSFDLAVTRFSGRPAAPPPGSDRIMRLSADAEQVSAGWWTGSAGFDEPAFFAYAYPRPPAIENGEIAPVGAAWNEELGEFLLPYEAVRTSDDPRAALLAFLRSTYAAGAEGLGWDPGLASVG